ncbi:MAG: DUF5050 domain-containing protein [Bacillota bacterium]
MRWQTRVTLFVCLLMVLFVPLHAEASTAKPEVRVYFEDEEIEFEGAHPYIEGGRTLVPVRFVSSAVGAQVDYNQATGQVTIVKGDNALFMTLGSAKAIVNDETVDLEVAPVLISGEPVVPLRFVSEALGAWVEWWNADRSVRVYPVAPTASAMANIMNHGLATSAGGWMYYVNYDGIYRLRRDGSEPSKIADTQASHLNIWENSLVFSPHHYDSSSSNAYSGSPWIFRIPVGGGEPEEVAHVSASQVAVIGEHVYYGGIEWENFERSVYRMDMDGSSVEKVVPNVVSRYYVDGDWVYYTYQGIYRGKLDGSAVEQICDFTVLSYKIVHDGWVYCVKWDDGCLYRVSTDGAQVQKLTDYRCQGLNIANGWIYFATQPAKNQDQEATAVPEIRRVRLDGSDMQVLATFQEPQCWAICVVDGWVFFETVAPSRTKQYGIDYKLYRMKTDGSDFEVLGQSYPEISITSPSGGETWHPGEEHVISWTTRNIPATHKVSVTIRRIPPPPLQEEGQEFDPIVFINLPNTGSVTWTISPMYPDGTYILRVAAYESIPITDEVWAESREFTITHP